MKRLIQWIQIPDFSPLPVMDRVFEECTSAFEDDGCIIRRVTCWEEVEDGGLLFMDDAAGRYHEPVFRAPFQRLAALCPNSIVVGWYWEHPGCENESFFSRIVRLSEHYLYRHNASPSRQVYMLRPDVVPLLLRAKEAPERIGFWERLPSSDQQDYCFMGGGYKKDWLPPPSLGFTGLYHEVTSNNFLSYETRREVYLSSRFSLAFQSDENIRTGHLSQRVFEGLAYGCIVFCENPLAEQYTRGAVLTVHSREDLWAKMKEWKEASPEKIREQQERGYEWSRQFGSNRTSMSLLWNRIQSRFHVKWDVSATSMVSVSVMGGLGNQLFQLAAGWAHAHQQGAHFHIQHRANHENGHRTFYWDTLLTSFRHHLRTTLPPPTEEWDGGPATAYRAIPSLVSSSSSSPSPPSLPLTHRRLNGYYQSSRYFGTYAMKNQLRHLFRVPSDVEHAVYHTYPEWIRNAHRVIVLHARRTDYLQHAGFHGPLPMSYYQQAVKRCLAEKWIEEPFFLLTGDDPAFWLTLSIDLPQVYACPHIILHKESDIRTFVLLQQFRHFIMSNSTFIWWTAWLARSPIKCIVPKQWFGPDGLPDWEDVYEPGWIRL